MANQFEYASKVHRVFRLADGSTLVREGKATWFSVTERDGTNGVKVRRYVLLPEAPSLEGATQIEGPPEGEDPKRRMPFGKSGVTEFVLAQDMSLPAREVVALAKKAGVRTTVSSVHMIRSKARKEGKTVSLVVRLGVMMDILQRIRAVLLPKPAKKDLTVMVQHVGKAEAEVASWTGTGASVRDYEDHFAGKTKEAKKLGKSIAEAASRSGLYRSVRLVDSSPKRETETFF